MPPGLALLSILNGSNYPCFELIFMVTKVFQPLEFDCKCLISVVFACSFPVRTVVNIPINLILKATNLKSI